MRVVKLLLLLGVLKNVGSVLVPELKSWSEDRYIQCVHCMDYDRSHISLFGCKPRRPILCNGNACFMRFHKEFERPSVMYTSGCLNLTLAEMETIAHAQKHSNETGNKNGSLLCEIAEKSDTCICSNMDKCNFINLSPDFSEYNRTPILKNVKIDEINHMKMFLPHEYRRLTTYRQYQQQSTIRVSHFWLIPMFAFPIITFFNR
ncbi:Protein CBG27619 [Caenorhabditis briggsae]|uniref:Uncharacterized protein n=2 Tax=Caenorhabditis briggsae TaxID=6238 RepID=A0AAE8ZWH4_CAEBR|nr:Protein CBG27619 [Caenorhabditis briggsae]ULT81615.1 hypothetical protein L3Y34_011535 [Caenorhabditis briggsae]CAR99898.1 Protein CBG27619 [Caenorhabditis briggsae]